MKLNKKIIQNQTLLIIKFQFEYSRKHQKQYYESNLKVHVF